MQYDLFWKLLCAHALCDFPLQGDFLAVNKNHKFKNPGVPWFICLLAHALIHGGAVYLITHRLDLGVAETLMHLFIDFCKCEGMYGFTADQVFHVICKIAWLRITL